MTQELTAIWLEEIRDFLLGRLGANASAVPLRSARSHELRIPPIRRWWIFEGKHYGLIGGPLAANFAQALAIAQRLDFTFNPRLRLSDRPDGEVDWGQTLARGAYRARADFVVRSSGAGLDESERAALRGWVKWLEVEWGEYTSTVSSNVIFDAGGFGSDVQGPFPVERLRRWAHVARRSRWPLLREVVAESLRPMLETDEIDRVPLPADPARIFELLCVVRIARHFVPSPNDLRWLDFQSLGNRLQFGPLSCRYQQGLAAINVLDSPDYRGALARAIVAFDVGIPKYVDIAFEFEQSLCGFDGILVEAKSGSQQFRDAVPQLRTYQASRPRRPGARYLVWGIVQGPVTADATRERIINVAASAKADEDVWVFSSADGIGTVLETLLSTGHGL